jgi:hypothetical protein
MKHEPSVVAIADAQRRTPIAVAMGRFGAVARKVAAMGHLPAAERAGDGKSVGDYRVARR